MSRGAICRVRLPRSQGHEQSGTRFAVVVQADDLQTLSTVIVAPTSQSAAPATFRPEIDIEGQATRVLVEQLRTVDVRRLERPIGHLTLSQQQAVDDALGLVLALV